MSFKKLSEIVNTKNGYNALGEILLTQYETIVTQSYTPNGLVSNPEQKQQQDINSLITKARIKIDTKYPEYLSLVQSIWEAHLSNDEIEALFKALDNNQVKKFFETSKKVEDDMKVSIQPFMQQLFQSIIDAEN